MLQLPLWLDWTLEHLLISLVHQGKHLVHLGQHATDSWPEHRIEVHHVQTVSPLLLVGYWAPGIQASSSGSLLLNHSMRSVEVVVPCIGYLRRNGLVELDEALVSLDLQVVKLSS